jgi:hypothetical protein
VTNQQPFSRGASAVPSIPKGDPLGTYESYHEAQQVVEKLAKSDFDVTKLAIIGNELKTVERVTGKLTYGRVAVGGAASGAWFGLFGGVLLLLISAGSNFGYLLAAILIGAGFGMLFGIVTYGINRRRQDYTSTHQVVASSYQVIAPSDTIARAQELLSRPDL